MALSFMNSHNNISTTLCVFIIFAIINLSFSQTLTDKCPVDMYIHGWPSVQDCRNVLDEYLFAISKHANQTGEIFLNSLQQESCLDSMRRVNGNISRCGIEKLIIGDSRCSNYSITDVWTNMGNQLQNLEQDCKFSHWDDEFEETCSGCLRKWEEIELSMNKVTFLFPKFSVLVVLASTRVDDEKWTKAIFKCLGRQSLNSFADDQAEKLMNHYSQKSKSEIGFLIGGVVGIICILIVAMWIICWKHRKPKLVKDKSDIESSSITVFSPRKITLKDVYNATNNLNESNYIGQGIAGKVYKGVLLNGQHIAVKHIPNDGQMETFVREVQSLSHVKHPNLVTLIGHCEREEESFLIYELCHNGNLSEWLFGKEKNLVWRKRLEISLDCARGLLFLHTYPQGCIVHRDIKPTNILICANFQAKLSDFGLSKVMNMGQSFVSSEVRGTFGYVDPEYRQNHRVNSSGDVYSFGIVLLQLISGQRVINLDRPMPISKMAKTLTISGNIFEFADPKLNGEYSDEAFELVLKLAMSCSGIKMQRPNMKQVVKSLERALDLSEMEMSEIPSYSQD